MQTRKTRNHSSGYYTTLSTSVNNKRRTTSNANDQVTKKSNVNKTEGEKLPKQKKRNKDDTKNKKMTPVKISPEKEKSPVYNKNQTIYKKKNGSTGDM